MKTEIVLMSLRQAHIETDKKIAVTLFNALAREAGRTIQI
jgi:hypothetical protein